MKTMKVGILGSGDVGKSFAHGFGAIGHEVKIGSRSPEKLSDFVSGEGTPVSAGGHPSGAVGPMGTCIQDASQITSA